MAPPRFIAPKLSDNPEPGKGRLSLVFSGDRRWCTFPDDRLIKPLEDPRKAALVGHKNQVYTFGYQFTIAAIKRGAPDRPLMLFESPVIRTAQMMPAVKAGGSPSPHKITLGPSMGAHSGSERSKALEDGSTLVPVWQEVMRCTTLPDRFDFDLDPGSYDLYVAFDLLGREGGWGHRTIGYQTEVPVEAGRATRLEAVANMAGGTERELSFEKASLLAPSQAAGADGP